MFNSMIINHIIKHLKKRDNIEFAVVPHIIGARTTLDQILIIVIDRLNVNNSHPIIMFKKHLFFDKNRDICVNISDPDMFQTLQEWLDNI